MENLGIKLSYFNRSKTKQNIQNTNVLGEWFCCENNLQPLTNQCTGTTESFWYFECTRRMERIRFANFRIHQETYGVRLENQFLTRTRNLLNIVLFFF